MTLLLLAPLLIFGILPFILGLAVIWSIVRPQKAPADESNRINKLILIWFAMTREDKFVGLLPFLKNDLWENFH